MHTGDLRDHAVGGNAMNEINSTCKNIYAFIRMRLGTQISDREIARRWPMEWKSFNGLKHGKRQVPRIVDLEGLAKLLNLDAAFVFEVARGTSAELVNALLTEGDVARLSDLLLTNTLQSHASNGSNGKNVPSSAPVATTHTTSETSFPVQAAAGCLVIERDGTITAMNRWASDSQSTASEMIGKNAFYVFDDFGGSHCPVTRAFESGRPEQDVVRRRASNGVDRMIHRCAQPVLDDAGEVIRVIEVDVDLTDTFQHAAPEMLESMTSSTPEAFERRAYVESLSSDSAQP